MRRFVSILRDVSIGGVAAILVGVLAFAAGATPGDHNELTDCRGLDLPTFETEIDTLLDKENGLLYLSWFDSSIREDRNVTIAYQDAACAENPKVNEEIEHVLTADAENQEEECAATTRMVRTGAPRIVRGIPVNFEAAKVYLREWCD